jgi:hypothetical protein
MPHEGGELLRAQGQGGLPPGPFPPRTTVIFFSSLLLVAEEKKSKRRNRIWSFPDSF